MFSSTLSSVSLTLNTKLKPGTELTYNTGLALQGDSELIRAKRQISNAFVWRQKFDTEDWDIEASGQWKDTGVDHAGFVSNSVQAQSKRAMWTRFAARAEFLTLAAVTPKLFLFTQPKDRVVLSAGQKVTENLDVGIEFINTLQEARNIVVSANGNFTKLLSFNTFANFKKLQRQERYSPTLLSLKTHSEFSDNLLMNSVVEKTLYPEDPSTTDFKFRLEVIQKVRSSGITITGSYDHNIKVICRKPSNEVKEIGPVISVGISKSFLPIQPPSPPSPPAASTAIVRPNEKPAAEQAPAEPVGRITSISASMNTKGILNTSMAIQLANNLETSVSFESDVIKQNTIPKLRVAFTLKDL